MPPFGVDWVDSQISLEGLCVCSGNVLGSPQVEVESVIGRRLSRMHCLRLLERDKLKIDGWTHC